MLKSRLILFLFLILVLPTIAVANVTITPATGGEAISADDAVSGTFTQLTQLLITEGNPEALSLGTIVLRAPSGFIWDVSQTLVFDVDTPPGVGGNTNLEVEFVSISETNIRIEITNTSAGAGGSARAGEISIENIAIRPTSAMVPNSGFIQNTGSSGPVGSVSYGDVAIVTGAPANVRVETQPDGSGNLLPEQSVSVIQPVTGYAIVTDQSNNFIENAAADSWQLVNVSGGIVQSALTPAGDDQSAEFSSEITGTARIQANIGGLNSEPSGVITITSGAPAEIVIDEQPSSTAQAGEFFLQQPVIHVLDGFGNLITQSYEISVQKNSGPGSLTGTTTLTRNNGVFEFSNLAGTAVGTIDLSFSGSGVASVVSSAIAISPGNPSALRFEVQPSNALPEDPISPAVQVQVIDDFDNDVTTSGISISMVLSSGNGSLFGTTTQNTNAQGIATFSDLSINTTGTKRITASSGGLGSVQSNLFNILNAGELSHFLIENDGGGAIPTQTAGENFQIQISARDVLNDPITDDIDIVLDSDATLLGGAQSITLTNGSQNNITVALQDAGDVTLTAQQVGNGASGTSNIFTLQPAGVDLGMSEINANPTEITANGISTSSITVTLRDQYGNQQTSGGENVQISTTVGSLDGSVSDNGDGSYTQNLVSSTVLETATVSATVNGSAITSGNAQVAFVAGQVSSFEVTLQSGGNIPDHQAGTTHNLRIRALDSSGNIASGFTGTVNVTSSGTFDSGGGTSPAFSNGELQNYQVAFSSTGSFQVAVQNANGTQTGSSNTFEVSPGPPSVDFSTVTSSPSVIETGGTTDAEITVVLRDEFGNEMNSGGDNVVLNTTAGTLSAVNDNGNGTYTVFLSPSGTNETATVSATVNGNGINDQTTVQFAEFNTWLSAGQPPNRNSWVAGNWSLGLPNANHIIVVPENPAEGTGFPQLVNATATVAQVIVEAGASLNVLDNGTLNINGDALGGGSITISNSVLNMTGDKLVQNLNAGTSTVTLNGSSDGQLIQNNFLVENLNFSNTSGNPITIDGLMLTFGDWNINSPAIITNDGEIEALDVNVTSSLQANNGTFRIAGDLNISGGGSVNFSGANVHIQGESAQSLDDFGPVRNLIVSSDAEAEVTGNITVSEELDLDSGVLVLGVDNELMYEELSENSGQVRMQRAITGNRGWRTMGSPFPTTAGDFLSEVISQGFTGATYPGDQPNILWYDETFEGTENERWRTFGNASNQMVRGRGYFLYVFGDIAGDGRYNDPLPKTISFSGVPPQVSDPIDFGVTYTADADTGWNFIANPYASSINWDHFTWNKTNVDNTVYVWDSSANAGDGAYLVWNGIGGSLGSGLIAPHQGFWIKANENPELEVSPAARTTGGAFFKIEEEDPPPSFSIRAIHKESGREGNAWFTFSENSKIGKDRLDAYQLHSMADSYVAFYSLGPDKQPLAINSLPKRHYEPIQIPIVLETRIDGRRTGGTYDIIIDDMSRIPSSWEITIRDEENGQAYRIGQQKSLRIEMQDPEQTEQRNRVSEITEEDSLIFSMPGKHSSQQPARFTLTVLPDAPLENDIPETVFLQQNYPNPFNAQTRIPFGLPEESSVRIEVFDILGRKVKTIFDGMASAGYHQVTWNAGSAATGVYIIRMVSSDQIIVQKTLLVR